MAAKYDDVIMFSLDKKDDFGHANLLEVKYRKKGKKFHHVVLTTNPDSTELSELRKKYPLLANETVDIKTIQEEGTGTPPQLKRAIHKRTKVIIRGHGDANVDYIGSETGSRIITMCELAKLLKKKCIDSTIQISLHVCSAGRGKAIGTVKGSIAKALHYNLVELGMEPTVSAPTSRITIFCTNGRKAVDLVIDDSFLIFVQNYGSTIQEQISALSIFPWVSTRRKLQKLYDMEQSCIARPSHKGLDSKVIIKPNGTPYFPYAASEFAVLSDEDEKIKILYCYHQDQRVYRDSARAICLQYLADIAAENSEIQNYKGFQRLKEIICIHPYPYPALLSYIADNQKNKTELMQLSATGTWEETSDDNPDAQEKRREILSTVFDNFKYKINTDLELKELQREHTAHAMDTKYRTIIKKSDKLKTIDSLILALSGFLVFWGIALILVIIAPEFPVMPFVAMGVAVLSCGLINGCRYLLVRSDSKQRVMKCPDAVASASSDVSSSKRYSDSKLSGKEEEEEEEKEPLLPRTPNQSKVFEGLIQCGLFDKETTQEGINTPMLVSNLGL
jgi:hypothetical protein